LDFSSKGYRIIGRNTIKLIVLLEVPIGELFEVVNLLNRYASLTISLSGDWSLKNRKSSVWYKLTINIFSLKVRNKKTKQIAWF